MILVSVPSAGGLWNWPLELNVIPRMSFDIRMVSINRDESSERKSMGPFPKETLIQAEKIALGKEVAPRQKRVFSVH
jgi:hypothetical protein